MAAWLASSVYMVVIADIAFKDVGDAHLLDVFLWEEGTGGMYRMRGDGGTPGAQEGDRTDIWS